MSGWAYLLRIAAITLLAAFLVGVGIALREFEDFARAPGALWLLFPLVAGALLGVLIPQLGHGLGALLLMLVAGGLIAFAAVVYPELTQGQLGAEVAYRFALERALQGVIFTAPLSIVGLLLGHFLAARWDESSL